MKTLTTGVSDTVSRFNQGKAARLLFIVLLPTKLNYSISKVLLKGGFILAVKSTAEGLRIYYKYYNGMSVVKKIELVSKLSLRRSWNLTVLSREKEKSSLVVIVLSTKLGLLLDVECL